MIHQSLIIAHDFATDFTSAFLSVTRVLLMPIEGNLTFSKHFAAHVAACRLSSCLLGCSYLTPRSLLLLCERLLHHLLVACVLGLGSSLLCRSCWLALHGEDLVDWHESQVELLRLDLTLLGVLALYVAHECSLCLELSHTSDTFKNWSCHLVRI